MRATAHATVLGATITTIETLIVAGVQHVLFTELFARFAASFALTEAVCVSQLICLLWLQSFRFFFRAWRQYDDPHVTRLRRVFQNFTNMSCGSKFEMHWRGATTRVECLLHGVAVGCSLLVVVVGPLMLRTSDTTRLLARTRSLVTRQALQRSLRRDVILAGALFVVVVFGIVTPIASLIMRANCWLWFAL